MEKFHGKRSYSLWDIEFQILGIFLKFQFYKKTLQFFK